MQKFQEIFDNPANSHFEKVVFLSDTPAIGVVGAMNKEIYALMGTKELLAILKASVPAEALTGLGWGKSISHSGSIYQIDVTLTQEKTVRVEVIKLVQQKKEEVVEEKLVKKQEYVAVDPEVLDNLMQADALVYYCSNSSEPKEIAETLTKAGYEVRLTNDSNACIQAMNYKEFPIIGLVIEKEIIKDKVLVHLGSTQMHSRRSQFSFLLTPGIESGNPDLAYSLAVSLAVDSSAVKDFENLFGKNLLAWKRVFDPFREAISAKI